MQLCQNLPKSDFQNFRYEKHYHLVLQANSKKNCTKNKCYFLHLWEKRDYPMTFFLNSHLGLLRLLRLNNVRCWILIEIFLNKSELWNCYLTFSRLGVKLSDPPENFLNFFSKKTQAHYNLIFFQVWNNLDLEKLKFQVEISIKKMQYFWLSQVW